MLRKLLYFWRILIFLALAGFSPTTLAQNLNKHEWAKGKIVLTTGETLFGPLSYYYNKEIIQVKGTDGFIRTFSPVNVAYFQGFNEQKQIFQTFKPFLYSPNPDVPAFQTPTFFEVVTEGKYTLVKRTAFVIRNLDPIPRYTSLGRYYEPYSSTETARAGNNYQIAQLHSYYLLTPQNQIISLRHPKKDLEDLYEDKAAPMKAYIRGKKLSYKNPVALTHVVQYFNHL
ncbi:hypothetical protein AHMF7605_09720 [Adhaeribacter arboris]|uniref:Uncharacterized protein n=1 Tax=Adhaeribacter arboris TaxID=2072846 RepID=A0A2T2YE34_9BACT|nr:hypothetical protein [Adhaeribacter arboris]PSR53779.1 hypothetical protein AHMF7605_09720 [Adhaeribacter arboris]